MKFESCKRNWFFLAERLQFFIFTGRPTGRYDILWGNDLCSPISEYRILNCLAVGDKTCYPALAR